VLYHQHTLKNCKEFYLRLFVEIDSHTVVPVWFYQIKGEEL